MDVESSCSTVDASESVDGSVAVDGSYSCFKGDEDLRGTFRAAAEGLRFGVIGSLS